MDNSNKVNGTPKQLTMLTSGQLLAFNSDGEQIGNIQNEFAHGGPFDRGSLRDYANVAQEFFLMDWDTKQTMPLTKEQFITLFC